MARVAAAGSASLPVPEAARKPAGTTSANRGLKIVKSMTGVALCGLAVYSVLRTLVWTISTTASVTSPLVVVTAPVDGFVTYEALTPGAIVDTGRTLGKVRDPLADTRVVNDLAAKVAALSDEIQARKTLLVELEELRAELSKTAARSVAHSVRSLRLMLGEAQATAAVASDRLKLSQSESERNRELRPFGAVSGAVAERAEHDAEIAAQELLANTRKVENLQVVVDSATKGVLLNPTTGEPVNPTQQLNTVRLELTSQARQLEEREGQLEALKKHLEAEQRRLERIQEVQVVSPTRGRVWGMSQSTDRRVLRGDKLLSVTSCDDSMVVASVSRRNFDRLRAGTRAVFETAHTREVYEGRVMLLIGTLPPDQLLAGTLAVPGEARNADSYVVVLEFPELAAKVSRSCDLGATGEVQFFPE